MNRFFKGGDLEKYLSFRCSQLIQDIEGLGPHCLVKNDEPALCAQLLLRYKICAPRLICERLRLIEGDPKTLTLAVPFDGDATLLAFGIALSRNKAFSRCEIRNRELRLHIEPTASGKVREIVAQLQDELQSLEKIAAQYNDTLEQVIHEHLARLRQDLNFVGRQPSDPKLRRATVRAV
ncbi:MAG: hypothetical protein C4334_00035 [Pyrinomonas sp.]|uniref:hypothetical protein n=1 Tax=Pyrinomonas sp. TaxID=2080306 RepID=UPI00331659D5